MTIDVPAREDSPRVALMARWLSRGDPVYWPLWTDLSRDERAQVCVRLCRVGLVLVEPPITDFPRVRALPDPRD